MNQLSKILLETQDNGLLFWCPGCDCAHQIKHGEGTGPRWGWNGNVNKPTFTPSIAVTSAEGFCHSFVIDGRIQFLSDCSHELAGQTVDIPNM